MIVNVIRHLAFEDLGSFGRVLENKDIAIKYYEAGYDDLSGIDADSGELLIILGGPISVNDGDLFSFIETELHILKRRIALDKPTLGICLGAQLIARAMGARIYPGQHKEIGWSKLQLTSAGEASALSHLDAKHCSMLHWHGETFDLPERAELLASSAMYENQAFSVGKNILALQFHPEITQSGMERWYIGHIGEIMQTEGVSVTQLRRETQEFAPQLEVQGQLFFDSWFQSVTSSK